MDWTDEVRLKLKKKNQILFSKDSPFLQDLAVLIREQDRRTLVLWALALAEGSVMNLEEKYPGENRPREALEAARDWAAGTIGMRLAQRKILDCHAFAKETGCREDAALCHAVGQACSVVHTPGHAMGYPIYELTSIVLRLGVENGAEAIETRKREYIEKLIYWKEHVGEYKGTWAAFLMQ